MTGYFDALIRASGLAVERPPAGDGSDWTTKPDMTSPAATELDALDVEHVTAPVERVEAPVTAGEPSPVAAVPVRVPDETWHEPVARRVRDVAPRVKDDEVRREPRRPPSPAAHTDAAPAPPPHVTAPAAEHAALVSSHERTVRAALDWVAADPMRAASPQTPAPDRPGASPRSIRQGIPRPGPSRLHADDVRPDPGVSAVRSQSQPSVPPVDPALRSAPAEPPSIAVTARPQTSVPIAAAVAVEPTPPAPNADHRHVPPDEVVEVSIGAIHVRVDAPSAAAPPARRAHAPVSASRPVRDGLRRRALRRI